MLESSDIALNTATNVAIKKPRQAVGAALGSAFVPGIGQLALGEKRRAWIFFALLTVWFLLFLPPVRIPTFYPGGMFALFSAGALTIAASCQALRSQAKGRRPGSYWWLFAILPLACFVACVYWGGALRVSGYRLFRVPSSSMESTIVAGDEFLADMHSYRHSFPQHGNIVVLAAPNEPGVIVVKRAIAIPGDTIRGVDGQVYLDGHILDEPYVQHVGNAPEGLVNFGPILIPPQKLFVMGDNRDVSLDSRMAEFGLVDESAVLGKALYIMRSAHDRTGKMLH